MARVAQGVPDLPGQGVRPGVIYIEVDFNEEVRDDVFRLRRPQSVGEQVILYSLDEAEILTVSAKVVAPHEAQAVGPFKSITDSIERARFVLLLMGGVELPLPGAETGFTG